MYFKIDKIWEYCSSNRERIFKYIQNFMLYGTLILKKEQRLCLL